MNFRVEEIIKGRLFHLIFPTSETMCRAMMRFGEHYESPQFADKVFSRRQFARWYTETHDGKFTYYKDWSGYNIPGEYFTPFLDGKFDPLTILEKEVLEFIRAKTDPERRKFYIIATDEKGEATRHELAHAMYYLDIVYRGLVNDMVLDCLPDKEYCMEKIRGIGYHPKVVTDEMHAYLVDGFRSFNKHTGIVRKRWTNFFPYFYASSRINSLLDMSLALFEERMRREDSFSK